jgi:hypothetical protein
VNYLVVKTTRFTDFVFLAASLSHPFFFSECFDNLCTGILSVGFARKATHAY